jgi:hypothetical protein
MHPQQQVQLQLQNIQPPYVPAPNYHFQPADPGFEPPRGFQAIGGPLGGFQPVALPGPYHPPPPQLQQQDLMQQVFPVQQQHQQQQVYQPQVVPMEAQTEEAMRQARREVRRQRYEEEGGMGYY